MLCFTVYCVLYSVFYMLYDMVWYVLRGMVVIVLYCAYFIVCIAFYAFYCIHFLGLDWIVCNVWSVWYGIYCSVCIVLNVWNVLKRTECLVMHRMYCVGEDTAEASVTGVKHRRRARDKRWGDGVGSGLAVTPDAWAGVTALLGQAPWARMACRDVRERCTVTSPGEGFRCQGVPA